MDGTIYHWHPILAANPKCEEVSEDEAFPERVVKGRKSRIPLANDVEEAPVDNSAINRDASRRGFAITGTAGVRMAEPGV